MKLQFLSFDAIFAIIIFTFAITILGFVWYSISSQLATAYGTGTSAMQVQLEYLLENLLTQGYPPNWQSVVGTTNTLTWTNVSVGVGNGKPDQIDMNKFMTLMSMANNNYQATKQLLGIGFDYYVTLNVGSASVPIGLNPTKNGAVSIQVANKAVTVNGQSANLQIIVWTNSSFGIG